MMPALSGIKAAEAMLQSRETAAIPIQMLSAKGWLSEVDAGLARGATCYLVKPFSARELGDPVVEFLAERRCSRERRP